MRAAVTVALLACCSPNCASSPPGPAVVLGPTEYVREGATVDCRDTADAAARRSIPIAWKHPGNASSSDLAALDAWCAAVGPPLTRSVAVDRTTNGAQILAVTWNTHVGAGELERLVDAIRRGRLTGRRQKDFVLMLQEAVRRGPDVPATIPPGAAIAERIFLRRFPDRPDIRTLATRLGLNVVYIPSMRNGTVQEDRGNAILSTLPIVSAEGLELPLAHQRRVAVVATLARAGGELVRAVSVHLDTALRFGSGGPAAWRRRQGRAMVNELDPRAMPTMIGADLNTWWGRDEPVVSDFERLWPEVRDHVGSHATWSGPLGTGARLDHLFASGWGEPLDARRARTRFGSDHYPLYVLLP